MQQAVAIVIPIWKKDLNEFEKISFLQCCSVLRNHRIILAAYRKLDLTRYVYVLKNKSINYEIFYFKRSFSLSVFKV